MGNNHFVINKDTLKESKELSFASELAREKVFDPRAIEIVSVEQTSSIFSHICLVPLFDLHSASVGANAVREEKAVQFIAGTANAFCVLGGDMVNSIIKADQNCHDDKFGNQRAIAREIDLYSTIVDKIPLVLDGNHDGANGNRWAASNMSPTRHIVDGLRSYDPISHSWNGPQHCKFGAVLNFKLPTCDNKRELKTLSIYLHHGTGKGSSPASSVEQEFGKAIAYINEQGEMVDAIITGHHHSNTSGIIAQKVPVYDKEGRLVNVLKKNAVVVSESTLQEVCNYALAGGFAPTDSNVYIYDMCIARNNFFTTAKNNSQPEYVMKCTRIPMFRHKSDEYTQEAIDYMNTYAEPNLELLNYFVSKMSNEEVYSKLGEQVQSYGSLDYVAPCLKKETEGSRLDPSQLDQEEKEL